MSELTQSKCEPCRGGVPPLTESEIRPLASKVPDWSVLDVNGVKRLRREFRFDDFKSAMEFAAKVGDLAEQEQHHPDLHITWGKVMIEIWTHKIRGLHRNDFILAAKIDAIAAPAPN